MSDDEVDPFKLPGMITERQTVNIDDVSSSDDDDLGTFASLKSGAERKEALAKKERLQNEREAAKEEEERGGTSGEGAGAAVDDDDDECQIVELKHSPPKRGGKRTRSSPGRNGKSPELDPRDAELIAQDAKQRQLQSAARQKLKAAFELDDDDDDNSPAVRSGGRGGTSGGRGGASGASATARKVWLHVHTDGSERPQPLALSRDQPIGADFLKRVADGLALDAARIRLFRQPPSGDEGTAPLDLSRTPLELGLIASGGTPVSVWAVESEVATIRVRLQRGSATAEMDVPPNATIASLVEKYCALHGAGLTPAKVTLLFDGEALPSSGTLVQHEIEADDQIDVRVR